MPPTLTKLPQDEMKKPGRLRAVEPCGDFRLVCDVRNTSPDEAFRPRKSRPEHPLQWLVEPLLTEPSFVFKAWFGGRTVTLHGRHHLVLMTQGEPWQGVLVCTTHEHHASLCAEFPALVQHPVLGKWLYLSETVDTFERDARRLIQRVRVRDPRLGILPSPRKKRARKRIRFGGKL